MEVFGLNPSELVLMQGEIEAPYIQKPVIPGIECVGTVEDPGGSALHTGERVLALMGGNVPQLQWQLGGVHAGAGRPCFCHPSGAPG